MLVFLIVMLINFYEIVMSNKLIVLISLKCIGKFFMGKRKKESDVMILCNFNGLKVFFGFLGCNGKRRSRNFIWFFWLSKINFCFVGV